MAGRQLAQERELDPAAVDGDGAAGMEGAAAGDGQRARQLAAHGIDGGAPGGIELGRGREQSRRYRDGRGR